MAGNSDNWDSDNEVDIDSHGYCDFYWAGDEDTPRSNSGFVFLMADGAVSWRSRRQNTVATSSTEAGLVRLMRYG